MRVQLSKKMISDAGLHSPGDVVVVPDDQGRKMVSSKLAVELDSAGNPVAAPAPADMTPPATA
jgi:hypothetical protein